ncbi:glycosyltransferase [Brumimicrobium glaciale]|uniref:Glycosyltransferase n=1 Tax=Brumimicrobium glaciale TaxID=200475 RepID=A0A4Q4KND5_9FLAO|nr:glycosyltransferase family 4 protein [Brumimicrobium glaciale]RYM34520.1 glycosyltransferase [Brumimicrobium glaciale]
MILHITNDYANSAVYKNLISNLDQNGIEQIIYTPVKSKKSIGGNLIELKEKESKIIYSNILNMHVDRVLFNVKINKIYKDIQSKVDFKKVTCIHAHTWFSDGAIALKLHEKYGIPYIIAVRGTDLNQFWKLPHLKNQGIEILSHATKIIFITPRYQERFLELEKIKKLGNEIVKKTVVIPNGLDPYWLKNIEARKTKLSSPYMLLYIGVFTETKNVIKLVKSVKNIIEQGIDCKLTFVGGGGSQEKEIFKLIANNLHFEFLGNVYDKNELKSIFNETDIFTMTSVKETFGLVYAEALSQGVPVLYSENEGIDGVYDENIGVAVNPRSIKSTADGIKKMIDNYGQFNFEPKEIVAKLDWKKIALKYANLYKEVLNNETTP